MFYILSVCLAFSERSFETYKVKEHNLCTSCRCVEKPNTTAINQAYPTLVTQENHYDPWGVGIEREVVADTSKLPRFEMRDRFTYNGKELQGNLNYLDYGARMYDPSIGRWGVVDVLAEISRRFSPFVYGDNNSLKFVDPDGMASEDFTYSDGYSNLSARHSSGSVGFNGAYNNPIYDTKGNLLGTDDKGLKGEPIFMKKENFVQGMNHEDTLRNNLGSPGLSDRIAIANYLDSYLKLDKRPDYDGKLSLSEANQWWSEGGGKPLFVDAKLIDLSPVKKSDFKKVGAGRFYNFAFTSNTETGLVYGNIRLTLISNKGDVKLGGDNGILDKYDFDYKKGPENIPRNIATWFGEKLAGNGTPYIIYNYNLGKLK